MYLRSQCKLIIIMLFLFLLTFNISAQSGPPNPQNMKLVFEDNFTGSTLDSSKWLPCYWWNTNGCTNSGNHELQWFMPDDVYQQNGYLRLRARKRTINASDGKTYNYTSGMVTTDRFGSSGSPKFAFKYGYTEARIKIPKGRGLWPAFWLLPTDHSWPPEIDIMENLGHEINKVYMTYHWRDSGGVHRSAGQPYIGPDYSADWHTFAVHWLPGQLIWYVDGIERFRYTNSSVTSKDMYLILNLSVGGDWPGPPDSSTVFPAYMDIDYVRVWQSSGTTPIDGSDLVVTDLKVQESNWTTNNQIHFQITVKNQGTVATPNEWHGSTFYVDGSYVDWAGTTTSIAPGESRTFTSQGWVATKTSFQLRGLADDQNRISEINEDNNTLTKTITATPVATPTPVPTPTSNLLTNPGFEADAKITNVISGWSNWSSNSLITHGTWTPQAHGGTYFAYQWQSVSYSSWTYQRKTGLANGLYTLRAWVRSSGGQNEAQMGAVVGGKWIYTNIPIGWTWTQITLKDIPVTDGTCEVGFWSVAAANQEIDFDDVEFFKQ
jgi:beta-glucanase (GH16 family)